MPSYSFSREILPNIWLGTKNALRDETYRKHNYIIRDIIIESPYSTTIEPILTSQTATVTRVKMTGQENELELNTICNKIFPLIDEALEKDRGLLMSGESWNSPQIQLLELYCSNRTKMKREDVSLQIQSYLPK